MRNPFSFRGSTGASAYAALSVPLILLQHGGVALAFLMKGVPLRYDSGFWLLPLRRLAQLPDLPPWAAALAFAGSLLLAWMVAALSFRRAAGAGRGYALAALSLIPGVQLAAVALLAVTRDDHAARPRPPLPGADTGHIMQGVLAAVAITVSAVLVSAVSFGAYGWGLFVATPFLIGITTGYLVNREALLTVLDTMVLTVAAAALGCAALLALALEGLLCILLIAPLGGAMAAVGAVIGRAVALAGHRRGRPLLSLALLPAVFALEAAMPPAITILSTASVEIAAPPEDVWAALTDDDAIDAPSGVIGWAGLAYPIRGRLLGQGVGVKRIGEFSTGVAREVVTAWVPGRRLAFEVREQPPAMEEMSPYRRVHAPHLRGYFETGGTEFRLRLTSRGGTRLSVRATHILRLDPVLYWGPLARWAIRSNMARVLSDLKIRAERGDRRS